MINYREFVRFGVDPTQHQKEELMKKHYFFIILLILVLFQSIGYTQEKLVLSSGEWPPYTSEKLKHYGYGLHIVSEAFATQGVQVEYKFFPWKRSYILTQRGQFAGTALWFIDNERQKEFYFSEAVDKCKTVLFHRADKPVEWSTLEDLKKYRIGKTLGYSYGDKFHNAEKKYGYKVDISPTDIIGFKKLLKERIDAFACDFGVGYWIISNDFPAYQKNLITNNPNVVAENTIHFIVPKNQKDALNRVNVLNKGLAALKASGRLDKFEDNLISGYYRKNNHP